MESYFRPSVISRVIYKGWGNEHIIPWTKLCNAASRLLLLSGWTGRYRKWRLLSVQCAALGVLFWSTLVISSWIYGRKWYAIISLVYLEYYKLFLNIIVLLVLLWESIFLLIPSFVHLASSGHVRAAFVDISVHRLRMLPNHSNCMSSVFKDSVFKIANRDIQR